MAGVRQHILPRFLLKGFASKMDYQEVFTLVCRKGGNVFEANIKNVAVEKHFYTGPGEIMDYYKRHPEVVRKSIDDAILQRMNY